MKMNETSFVGIICFLLGVIVTSFGYTLVFSTKLSTVSGRVDTVSTKIDTHITSHGTCPVHATVAADAAVAKEKAEEANRRLLQLEEAKKRGG
jgi:hypothetical protein